MWCKEVYVEVPTEIRVECMEFAEAVVKSYRDGKKPRSQGLAREGRPRIDGDLGAQYDARLCEVAACIYLGLDPLAALSWLDVCDPGFDFSFAGLTIDVKGSKAGHPALIWPIEKLSFMGECADVLLLAGPRPAGAVLYAWTTKGVWLRDNRPARKAHRLDTGTPYLEGQELIDVTVLGVFGEGHYV